MIRTVREEAALAGLRSQWQSPVLPTAAQTLRPAGWKRAHAHVYARAMSRTPSPPVPLSPLADPIDASEARAILGDAPSTFEHRRRALELVLDRTTGARSTVPTFEDAKVERAWRARACLIVPEWGGIKFPGAQWQYSRRRLIAFLADPYDAVMSAKPVVPVYLSAVAEGDAAERA